MSIIKKQFIIRSHNGVHCRVAKQVAIVARSFSAEVRLLSKGVEADGDSILEILSLAMASGDTVEVEANGHDAGELVAALSRIFCSSEEEIS